MAEDMKILLTFVGIILVALGAGVISLAVNPEGFNLPAFRPGIGEPVEASDSTTEG